MDTNYEEDTHHVCVLWMFRTHVSLQLGQGREGAATVAGDEGRGRDTRASSGSGDPSSDRGGGGSGVVRGQTMDRRQGAKLVKWTDDATCNRREGILMLSFAQDYSR